MPAFVVPGRTVRADRLPAGPWEPNLSCSLADGMIGMADPIRQRIWWRGRWMPMTVVGTPTTLADPVTQALGYYTTASADAVEATGLVPVLSASAQLTMHTWARCTVSNTTRKRVMRLAGTTNGSVAFLDFAQGTSNIITAGIQTVGSGFPSANTTIAPDAHTTYAVGVIDTGSTVACLVNGRVEATASTGPAARNDTGSILHVGNSSSTFPFNGVVAPVVLWQRVLSAAERWALYHPATRWDLYWQPGRRVFFDVGAAAQNALLLRLHHEGLFVGQGGMVG